MITTKMNEHDECEENKCNTGTCSCGCESVGLADADLDFKSEGKAECKSESECEPEPEPESEPESECGCKVDSKAETKPHTKAEIKAEARAHSRGKHKSKEQEQEQELEAKLFTAIAKVNENYDLYLRNLAEFDNYRKRSAKEKENVYYDSIKDIVNVFLPIVDNFERALSVEVSSEDGVCLKTGVEMIFKQMNENFKKIGVTEIDTQGKTFDPNLHEAVAYIEDEDLGSQEIVEVFQKGYMLKDKVIRHSIVKVAN